jgi:hypothetical protein
MTYPTQNQKQSRIDLGPLHIDTDLALSGRLDLSANETSSELVLAVTTVARGCAGAL